MSNGSVMIVSYDKSSASNSEVGYSIYGVCAREPCFNRVSMFRRRYEISLSFQSACCFSDLFYFLSYLILRSMLSMLL